jgi:hypothetical protein
MSPVNDRLSVEGRNLTGMLAAARLRLPVTSAFSGRRPSRRVRAGGVLAANHPREFAFCSLKNAYSDGQKTARAQAATKQFSRTNPIATS